MKLSAREIILAWLTFFILLFAGTYFFCKPRVDGWRERRVMEKSLGNRVAAAEDLLAQRKSWEQRLQKLRQTVYALPAGRPAANYLKKTIGDLAMRINREPDHGITIRDRRAGGEQEHGGLYQMLIKCPWDGNTMGIVRLLLDFLEHDVMFDVTELWIISDGKDKLHGGVTLNCVYTKSGSSTQ